MKTLRTLIMIALPFTIIACGGDDNDTPTPTPTVEPTPTPEAMAEYRVQVINSTHNQPLSPLAVILHDIDYTPWTIGQAASAGLEQLAESGSPDDFLAEASSALSSETGQGIVAPGTSESIDISTTAQDAIYLTVASMLVNTNDAFSGISATALGEMAIGDTITITAPVYDAGTESNDEVAGSIPGPADGGEGFNAERETHDFVTRHPGVVTNIDGYETSVLDESHRFDNYAMRIIVERLN